MAANPALLAAGTTVFVLGDFLGWDGALAGYALCVNIFFPLGVAEIAVLVLCYGIAIEGESGVPALIADEADDERVAVRLFNGERVASSRYGP